MRPSETSFTPGTDNSWQEEAALFLIHSGFRPTNMIGQIEHSTTHKSVRTGRTFGSVWHAMRNFVEGEQERSASEAHDIACDQHRR